MGQIENLTISNLKKKTEEGFDHLYHRYYEDLVNYAFTFLLDSGEAEDLVQNLFIHFWENLDSFQLKGTLDGFFYTAVKNRCLNKLKSIDVYDKHKILYIEAMLVHLSREEEIDKSVLEEELLMAINNLPVQAREIIVLKYFKGQKIAEIAETLNLSENTVKTQLKRGKSKLRNEMNPKLFSIFFF
ncbi:RNA polymerase sigma-70 factor [Echinicola marina]|uniref:RNA polymerase sigma factor n=1 Tax=Echinicola marina TaxID=2859768 RepID=UPI001CF65AA9|nr:RNA polymerase sigma-70 factor [Echinicola marina]UCS92092.1 RNA polymerase sigma-70 factor [Echinicola marina]